MSNTAIRTVVLATIRKQQQLQESNKYNCNSSNQSLDVISLIFTVGSHDLCMKRVKETDYVIMRTAWLIRSFASSLSLHLVLSRLLSYSLKVFHSFSDRDTNPRLQLHAVVLYSIDGVVIAAQCTATFSRSIVLSRIQVLGAIHKLRQTLRGGGGRGSVTLCDKGGKGSYIL